MPPHSATRKSLKRSTGSPRMKRAGRVKIEPATMSPEAAPIDCTMTFSSRVERRFGMRPMPTARIAIGIAASNTCPTLKPRKAAAAEKTAAMITPSTTERGVHSAIWIECGTTGVYVSPGLSLR